MMASHASALSPRTEEIIRSLRANLPDLQRRYGITYLGVFGSYVRGEQKRRSDLDLLVEFDDRPLSLLGLVALERQLSSLVGVPVDLVEKQTLKPAIGRHILKEVVPVLKAHKNIRITCGTCWTQQRRPGVSLQG